LTFSFRLDSTKDIPEKPVDETHCLNHQDGAPLPRLDILLYAHDGRGLGHASRTIAIGTALRRLYPELRVLFISGAGISQSLIGRASLDWIKLPSYASTIKNGVSSGIDGPANFSKFALREYRALLLAQVVASFRPKIALVDHSPLGKREELTTALEASKPFRTTWILGLRAILGNPKNFWIERTKTVFAHHYHSIFWYGDRAVLGNSQIERIQNHFGQDPLEMGYVSRLHETLQLPVQQNEAVTCTVSLPWLSRATMHFIEALKQAISSRDSFENWRIFINDHDISEVQKKFHDLPYVKVEPVGQAYVESLVNSRMAVIYGGYNSLMDVVTAGVPALVAMREMKDKEQQEHIHRLRDHCPESFIMVEENSVNAEDLRESLSLLYKSKTEQPPINLKGSEAAARHISSLL